MGIFCAMTNKGAETKKEIRLAKEGNIHDLQQYRAKRFYKYNVEPIPFRAIVNIERNMRSWVQREIHLTEQIKSQSGDDQALQEKLSESKEHYWLCERKWWKVRDSFTEGPLTRGFDLWRSHQRWYLHRSLIEDCVLRGGCCGRDCRCCYNRIPSPTRKLGVGHCTIECGCCHKFRGFQLSKEGRQTMEKIFPLDGNTKRVMHIERVSIWGLRDGNQESPFDLIDEPPIYEKDQLKNRKSD